MTSTNLTGQENTRELLSLRRGRIRERRMKQASLLAGSPLREAHITEIIPFPAPDYPRTA